MVILRVLSTEPTVLAAGRHWYAILTGLLLIYYPFGNGVFHAFVPALLTYAFMLLARKQCGRLAWLVDFTYLIAWSALIPSQPSLLLT